MTVKEMQEKLKLENELLQMEEPPSNQQLAERLQVTNGILSELARYADGLLENIQALSEHQDSTDEAIKSIHARMVYGKSPSEEI